MRVVLANNYYYLRGGSDRVFFDEMRSLAHQGVEVIPYSQEWPENKSTEYARWFLCGQDYGELAAATLWKKLSQAIQIVYSTKQRRRFSEVLTRFKPRLVHGHIIDRALTLAVVDAAKSLGIPVVLTTHDLKLICPSCTMLNHGVICEKCLVRRYWQCIRQRCYKGSLASSMVVAAEAYFNWLLGKYEWVSKYIVPSRFFLEKHILGGVPREKLVYLPNGVDPDAYRPNIGSGGYVLFAGRLSPEKGVGTLLKAIGDTEIPLKVAGTGPLEKEYRAFAGEKGLENIEFCGYCQGDRLRSLYQGAMFVVLPSEWYENAPISILEAFASGKPVLGSNLGGIPELVLEGITGRLFKVGDVDDLKEKLIWMCNNKHQVADMGKAARYRVETEFSLEKHVNRLREIYQSILH